MVDQVATGGLQDVLLAGILGGQPNGNMPNQLAPVLDGFGGQVDAAQGLPPAALSALPPEILVALGQTPAAGGAGVNTQPFDLLQLLNGTIPPNA